MQISDYIFENYEIEFKYNLIEKNKLKEIMKELNLPETTRGESLTLEQFAEIAERV